ncbi:MAG: hypothetical protein ACXWMJ_06000, partial [Syntrophales bacterium]
SELLLFPSQRFISTVSEALLYKPLVDRAWFGCFGYPSHQAGCGACSRSHWRPLSEISRSSACGPSNDSAGCPPTAVFFATVLPASDLTYSAARRSQSAISLRA